MVSHFNDCPAPRWHPSSSTTNRQSETDVLGASPRGVEGAVPLASIDKHPHTLAIDFTTYQDVPNSIFGVPCSQVDFIPAQRTMNALF